MKSERLQVLIDVEQRARLERAAVARGVSLGALVRDAIDVVYPPQASRRAQLAAKILDAAPADVPAPDALRAELDDLRGRHG
ncbi:MAG: hypothetical protein QM626_04540 [Microbacterium sp.]|uniref:hypothetical protein n=1 Tax=Microbacterium sp. TaxID=51671 RepID=UPI0039E245CA